MSSVERPALPVMPSTQHSSKDSSDGLDHIDDHRGELPGVALTNLSEGEPSVSSLYPSVLPKLEAPLVKLEPIIRQTVVALHTNAIITQPIATIPTMSTIPFRMPMHSSERAPKFDGKVSSLLEFLDQYEVLANDGGLQGQDCIKQLLRYLPSDERELWSGLTDTPSCSI
ncbi:hypothetical protein BDR05DRAFT_953637 [Suillus weaverae]|nr:hypothetical protein BDR05DRAFT_953637 [Suillus weaverae]